MGSFFEIFFGGLTHHELLLSARQTNFGWARFWLMVVGDDIVRRVGSEFAWQKNCIVKRAVGVLVRDLRRPGPWWAYYGGVPRGSTTVCVAEIFLLRLYVVITSFGWRSSE